MGADDASELLRRYGIDEVPGGTVDLLHEDMASQLAEQLGYPVVAKLICPDNVHKSRSGLIALDLRSGGDLGEAIERMRHAHSSICSDEHELVLHLQHMIAKGLEVIAGVKVDPQFGPVLAVGLGGVAVEALGQISRALLPLTADEIDALVASGPVGRVLESLPGADRDALQRNLVAIANLAWDMRTTLTEADFNPITVLSEGMGAWCVDVRLFVESGGPGCQ